MSLVEKLKEWTYPAVLIGYFALLGYMTIGTAIHTHDIKKNLDLDAVYVGWRNNTFYGRLGVWPCLKP